MVTVFYKVFNEADFLKESLTTIYPYADKIVILEYCLESMQKIILPNRVTKQGLSVDGTTKIIEKFPDPAKKLEHKKIGFLYGAEEIPYQMIVDNINIGDYAWVIDGDIVYTKEFASIIRRDIDSGLYDVLWIPEVVFYHDFWHERTCFFTTHQRVFKKQSRVSFFPPGCFEVWWIDENPGSDAELFSYRRINEDTKEYQGKKLIGKTYDRFSDGFAYHYSYVRPVQRIIEKVLWQYEMIDRGWGNPPAVEHCKKFRNPLEFKLLAADFFAAHEMELTARYRGNHPDIMKHNKWYNYHWDEKPIPIAYEQARKMVRWAGEC